MWEGPATFLQRFWSLLLSSGMMVSCDSQERKDLFFHFKGRTYARQDGGGGGGGASFLSAER